jgi:hypothetical protein
MRQVPALYCFEEPPHWAAEVEEILENAIRGPEIKDNNGEIKFELIRPQATVESVMDFFITKQ